MKLAFNNVNKLCLRSVSSIPSTDKLKSREKSRHFPGADEGSVVWRGRHAVEAVSRAAAQLPVTAAGCHGVIARPVV